jgi:hypothetical protein
MKTLFGNRLFFIPFAIFLVFPFTHFFAAAPDAAVFEPIRTSIAKKIAEMQAAQADKNALTTAAPPPPNLDPDDDPNINKDDFGSILETWATAQKSTLESFISDPSISNSTFNTTILKSKIPKGEIKYKIIDDMKKAAHNVVVADEMLITDAAKFFIKCIDDNYPKTPEALKKLFGEDRKHYKGASEATFRLALDNVNFAGWMQPEYTKAKATLISQEDFISHSGFLVLDIMNKLSAHKTDSFTVKTADILSAWTILFSKDSEKIFSPLEDCIKQLDTLILITDFYDALGKCSQVHFSKEALLKIPAEKYTKCKYVIELSKNGQSFFEATIRYKYD